jgi:hypothetical protein
VSAQEQQVVTASVIGTGVFSALGYVHRKHSFPPVKIAAGTIAVGALLSLFGEYAPKAAAAFASVMLVTAVFVVGGDAWAGIAAGIGSSDPAPTGPPAGTPSVNLPPNTQGVHGALGNGVLFQS